MTFDWIAATLAGFRIVGAKFYALLFWTFTVMAALAIGIFIWGRAGTATLSPSMMQITMVLVIAPIMILAFAMVICAVYRILLRPGERAFLGLRIGSDELRVAVWLALIMVFIGTAFLMAAYSGWLWAPVVLAVVAAMSRVALIGPAIFSERRFAILEGWHRADGNLWTLFVMNLATAAIYFAVFYALQYLWRLFATRLFAAPMAAGDPTQSLPFMFGIIVVLVAYTALLVVIAAPGAAAYKALAKPIDRTAETFD